MLNKYQGICKDCKKTYSIDFLKDSICENCFHLSKYQDQICRRNIKTQICEVCEKEFKDYKCLRYCSYKCKCILFPEKKRKPKTRKDSRSRIEILNSKWLDADSKKKPKKRITFEQMAQKSNVKLIFDESGWFHYLKGKKWNRV
jgi:hypothetical protein